MTSSKILTELTEPMPSSSQKHLCPKPCKLVISGEFKTMMMKVWLVIPWVAPDETEKKFSQSFRTWEAPTSDCDI